MDSVAHGEYLNHIASRSELTQAPVLALPVTGAEGRQTAVAPSAVGILDLPCALAERKEVIQ